MTRFTITATEYRAAQARAMSEDQLLRAVKAIALGLGYRIYHTYDSRRCEAGYPDLAIAGHGRFMLRELKAAKGRLTPAQLWWLSALTDAGVDVGMWRPTDLLDGTIYRQLSLDTHTRRAI